MKKVSFLLVVIISLLACNRPIKLLEKGHTEKALKVSLRHLKKGKVKERHLYALEKSYLIQTEKDAQWINNAKQNGGELKWVVLHDKAKKMIKQQSQIQKVLDRLHRKGHYPNIDFYPAQALFEESRDKAALYYYAQAQAFIPSARNGNRIAARQAYSLLEQIKQYRSDFKDSKAQKLEMHDLGTVHIFLNPVESDLYTEEDILLFNSFLRNQKFPKREKWHLFHLDTIATNRIDYRLDLRFDDIYVSNDEEYHFSCTNTKSVLSHYEEEEVWCPVDSAYVTECEPVYIDVRVRIRTYEQSKKASLKLAADLYNQSNNRWMDKLVFEGSESWSNSYSVVRGDRRAIDAGCRDRRGSRSRYPSDFALLEDAADAVHFPFFKKVNRLFKNRIANDKQRTANRE